MKSWLMFDRFKEVMKVVKEEAPNTADALRSLTSKL